MFACFFTVIKSFKASSTVSFEGSGIGRLLAKKCDGFISVPCCGKLDSLNVSVAAGILLYERHRQCLIRTAGGENCNKS